MLRAIGFVFKIFGFAAIVLILGNYFHWKGRTVSDQVKQEMAHAENSDVVDHVTDKIKDWASAINYGAPNAPRPHHAKIHERPELKKAVSDEEARSTEASKEVDDIGASERQKLRSLIQDLNRAHR